MQEIQGGLEEADFNHLNTGKSDGKFRRLATSIIDICKQNHYLTILKKKSYGLALFRLHFFA